MADDEGRYIGHIRAAIVAVVIGGVFGLLLSLLRVSQRVTFGVAIIGGLFILLVLEIVERHRHPHYWLMPRNPPIPGSPEDIGEFERKRREIERSAKAVSTGGVSPPSKEDFDKREGG